jgi:hypothetical protein
MAKPKLTPQTPGEPVQDPAELTIPAAEAEAAAPEADQPTTTETVEAVTEAPAVVAAAPGELPDESEIDPAAIERPVLTKQGWVVPHKAA